jgi:predicted lactoylglutathione lyase
MVWSEAIIFHLLTRDFFASFTPKPVAEAQKASEMLIALTMDSREQVDAIVEAAGVAGGRADPRAPTDMGWLYNRAFEDPDGHIFEAVWVDMAAAAATGE